MPAEEKSEAKVVSLVGGVTVVADTVADSVAVKADTVVDNAVVEGLSVVNGVVVLMAEEKID